MVWGKKLVFASSQAILVLCCEVLLIYLEHFAYPFHESSF